MPLPLFPPRLAIGDTTAEARASTPFLTRTTAQIASDDDIAGPSQIRPPPYGLRTVTRQARRQTVHVRQTRAKAVLGIAVGGAI